MIIKTLSDWQIGALKGYFFLATVTKIGLIEETGVLIVEYMRDGIPNVTNIPRYPNMSSEETEFEIIQPKQLTCIK
jgi:hypothetical protein